MSTAPDRAPRVIRCPGCSGPSVYAPDNPWRPFCSARCKQHDFGAWATERYAVASRSDDAADGDLSDEPAPGRPPS